MYTLSKDRSRNLIEAKLGGFLNVPEVEEYAAAAAALIGSVGAQRGGYIMLIDVTECVIQPQEGIEAFRTHVAAVPQARRLAAVTGSSLATLQIRRVLKGPGMQVFSERNDAFSWLIVADERLRSPAFRYGSRFNHEPLERGHACPPNPDILASIGGYRLPAVLLTHAFPSVRLSKEE